MGGAFSVEAFGRPAAVYEVEGRSAYGDALKHPHFSLNLADRQEQKSHADFQSS